VELQLKVDRVDRVAVLLQILLVLHLEALVLVVKVTNGG
jgi:hypothetical protein